MKPTIGRIVIYKFSDYEKCPHVNNADECPAIIVRVWSDTCVNLKLLVDGPDVPWFTSIVQGDQQRQWHWPERVPPAPDLPAMPTPLSVGSTVFITPTPMLKTTGPVWCYTCGCQLPGTRPDCFCSCHSKGNA